MPRHPDLRLVFADASGRIFDHPDLLMLTRRGEELALPRPGEAMPLPPESELFVLPGRRPVGLDPETGRAEALAGEGEQAVAAFVCPGHTAAGVAAYLREPGAPTLPMFSYAAVGYAGGRLWSAPGRWTRTAARSLPASPGSASPAARSGSWPPIPGTGSWPTWPAAP